MMEGQATQAGRAGRTLAESSPSFCEPRRPRAGAPNVVMIVLDDLGFAELGCFGSAIATPSIDGLAENGLRYNNFHVTAVCSATRASLLSGRNHHAVGMGFLTHFSMESPGYTSRIPKSAAMLPRLLRDAGYGTFAVGKWHLTPHVETGPAGPFDRWPLAMGFERYYGFIGGMTSQWMPDLVRDNGSIDPPRSPDEGYHLTEDLAAQAIRMVQDHWHAAPDKPFFLYFATGATHSPQQVADQWVERYRNAFDGGWEALREQTFRRQQELGVVPPDAVLTGRPSWVAAWKDLPSHERRIYARMMEVYAGFLTHTDAQIRRLLGFLGTIGVLDNTIVMVLSDNGASADGGPHGVLDLDTTDVDAMRGRIEDFGGYQALNHYAWGWTWAGNTPFRLWKKYTWLGGVRTPLVVQWPARTPADHLGQVRRQFCHAIDVMPTVLEAAGVDVPDVIDGVSQQRIDGSSLMETLSNAGEPSPRNTQYFEMLGSRAVYHDGWKATTDHVLDFPVHRELIEGSHDFQTDRWSLFNTTEDFSESHDRAADEPDRLRRMIELWWFEAGRNQVLPLMDNLGGHGPVVEPHAAADASSPAGWRRYVCLPGAGPVDTPSPFLAGFRLIADVELPESSDAAGIICAHRTLIWGCLTPGGWVSYVLDGRVVVTFRLGGTHWQTVSQPLPAGRHDLRITYVSDPGDGNDGSVTVSLDGRAVAAGPGPGAHALASRRSKPARLLVGRDIGVPVCDDYTPPFPFTGRIHNVAVEIPKAELPDFRETIKSALRSD